MHREYIHVSCNGIQTGKFLVLQILCLYSRFLWIKLCPKFFLFGWLACRKGIAHALIFFFFPMIFFFPTTVDLGNPVEWFWRNGKDFFQTRVWPWYVFYPVYEDDVQLCSFLIFIYFRCMKHDKFRWLLQSWKVFVTTGGAGCLNTDFF